MRDLDGFSGCVASERGVTGLQPLPDPVGVAAPFAGVSGEELLVAGGTHFPNRPPRKGGWNCSEGKSSAQGSPLGVLALGVDRKLRQAHRRRPAANGVGTGEEGIGDVLQCRGAPDRDERHRDMTAGPRGPWLHDWRCSPLASRGTTCLCRLS
jgi:hypothetical protein